MSDSRSTLQNPSQYDVFLSHNRAQKDWTRTLARRLRDEGFQVWFDEWCLRTGENWIRALARGVEENTKIALVLSPQFLDAEWPGFEANVAILGDPAARDARIFPLIHTSCNVPSELAFRQALDFSDTHTDSVRYEFRLAQLMADLDTSRYRPTDFEQFCQTSEELPPNGLPRVRALPAGSVMPFLPNPNFVGREEELNELYRKLDAGISVSLGQTAVLPDWVALARHSWLWSSLIAMAGTLTAGCSGWICQSLQISPARLPNAVESEV